MTKYKVPISWDFTVDAADADEAKRIVTAALNGLLPGDGWVLGETLSAEYMVDEPIEVEEARVMEQPLEIPITVGFDPQRVVGKMSFKSAEDAQQLMGMWASNDISISPTVASYRVNPDKPLEEVTVVPAANVVPIIRYEDKTKDALERELEGLFNDAFADGEDGRELREPKLAREYAVKAMELMRRYDPELEEL